MSALFPYNTLNVSSHHLLASIISAEKLVVGLFTAPLDNVYSFLPLTAFKKCSFSLIWSTVHLVWFSLYSLYFWLVKSVTYCVIHYPFLPELQLHTFKNLSSFPICRPCLFLYFPILFAFHA